MLKYNENILKDISFKGMSVLPERFKVQPDGVKSRLNPIWTTISDDSDDDNDGINDDDDSDDDGDGIPDSEDDDHPDHDDDNDEL